MCKVFQIFGLRAYNKILNIQYRVLSIFCKVFSNNWTLQKVTINFPIEKEAKDTTDIKKAIFTKMYIFNLSYSFGGMLCFEPRRFILSQ